MNSAEVLGGGGGAKYRTSNRPYIEQLISGLVAEEDSQIRCLKHGVRDERFRKAKAPPWRYPPFSASSVVMSKHERSGRMSWLMMRINILTRSEYSGGSYPVQRVQPFQVARDGLVMS